MPTCSVISACCSVHSNGRSMCSVERTVRRYYISCSTVTTRGDSNLKIKVPAFLHPTYSCQRIRLNPGLCTEHNSVRLFVVQNVTLYAMGGRGRCGFFPDVTGLCFLHNTHRPVALSYRTTFFFIITILTLHPPLLIYHISLPFLPCAVAVAVFFLFFFFGSALWWFVLVNHPSRLLTPPPSPLFFWF